MGRQKAQLMTDSLLLKLNQQRERVQFDEPGKIKEGKQEKQVLEDESEANGQIQRISSVGAKFLLFLSFPVDTLLHQ